MRLGTADVLVRAKTDQYQKDLKTAEGQTQTFGKNAVTSIKSVGSSFLALAGVGGVGALSVSMVKAGADFELQMATVQGVMRASKEQLQQLTDAAKEWGEKTEWSARQSGEALNYMGMAGWDVNKSIAALPSVLNLATAANMDLGQASDIVTDSLTAMGMGVEDLSRFNDVLTGTTTRSNTTITMMGESLKYSAPIAKQYGYDIETLSAMIGTLANAGIKASDAGTDLRQAMVRNAKAAKELGTVEDDLIGTLKAAKDAGWGVNDVTEKYGMIASKSVLVLMDQIDSFEKLKEQLYHVQGETDKLAKTKLDTLLGDWKIFTSLVNSIGIDSIEKATDGLRENLQGMTKDLQEMKPVLVDIVGHIDSVVDGLTHVGRMAIVGGVLYSVPTVVAATSVAFKALTLDVAAFNLLLSVSPNPITTGLTTPLWGTSTAAQIATGELTKLKRATLSLFSLYAGWEFGSWLNDNFETARLAGIAFVDGTIKGFEYLQYGAKVAWAAIESSWDTIITNMKEGFAAFLVQMASDIEALPFTDGIANQILAVAQGIDTSAKNTTTFTEKQAALKAELEQNLAVHELTINAMLEQEGIITTLPSKIDAVVKKAKEAGDAAKTVIDDGSEAVQIAAETSAKLWKESHEKQYADFQKMNSDIQAGIDVATAYKTKKTEEFTEAHQKATLDQFEYAEKQLQKEYDLYAAVVEDKAALEEWFSAEKKKIEEARTEAAKKELEKENKAMIDTWRHATENMHDIFADFWGDTLRGGTDSFSDFCDDIWDMFIDLVAQMAAYDMMNIFGLSSGTGVGLFTGGSTGGGIFGSSSSSGFGISDIFSIGKTGYSLLNGDFSSLSTMLSSLGSTSTIGSGYSSLYYTGEFGTSSALSSVGGLSSLLGGAAFAAFGSFVVSKIMEGMEDTPDSELIFRDLTDSAFYDNKATWSGSDSGLPYQIKAMAEGWGNEFSGAAVKYFETIFTTIDGYTTASISDIMASVPEHLRLTVYGTDYASTDDALAALSDQVFSEYIGFILADMFPDAGTIEKAFERSVINESWTGGREGDTWTTDTVTEQVTAHVSAMYDTFDQAFFDAIKPIMTDADGNEIIGNSWDAFVRFADVVQTSTDFLGDFTRQTEEYGESAAKAFENIEYIYQALATVDATIDSIVAGSDYVSALEEIDAVWKSIIDTLETAHATVEQVDKAYQGWNVSIGATLSGLTASGLESSILTTSLQDSVDTVVSNMAAAFISETISPYLLDINEQIGKAWTDSGGDLAVVIETLRGIDLTDVTAKVDALKESFGIVSDATEEVSETVDDLADQIVEFNSDIQDIIDQNTLSDYEYDIKKLNNWYIETAAEAESLGLSLDDVTEAYWLQKNALDAIEADRVAEDLQDLVDSITDFDSSIQDIVDKNTLSDYEYNIKQLGLWFDEQYALAVELGVPTDNLFLAYWLQRNDLDAEESNRIAEEAQTLLDDSRVNLINSLKAEISSLEDQRDAFKEAAESARDNYIDALENEIDAQEELKDAAEDAAEGLQDAIDALSSTKLNLLSDAGVDLTKTEWNSAIQKIFAGDLSGLSDLPTLAKAYRDAAADNAKTRDEANEITNEIYKQLTSAQEIAEAQKTIEETTAATAESQIFALESQIDILNGVDSSLLSIDQAADDYYAAALALDESGFDTQISQLESVLAELESIDGGVLSLADALEAYKEAGGTGIVDISSVTSGATTVVTEADYYSAKANQLNNNPDDLTVQAANERYGHVGIWTDDDVKAVFEQEGLTPESHWQQWGQFEGLNLQSFDGGGLSSGPDTGYLVEMHGDEGVFKMKNGVIPFRVSGGGSGQENTGSSTTIQNIENTLGDINYRLSALEDWFSEDELIEVGTDGTPYLRVKVAS